MLPCSALLRTHPSIIRRTADRHAARCCASSGSPWTPVRHPSHLIVQYCNDNGKRSYDARRHIDFRGGLKLQSRRVLLVACRAGWPSRGRLLHPPSPTHGSEVGPCPRHLYRTAPHRSVSYTVSVSLLRHCGLVRLGLPFPPAQKQRTPSRIGSDSRLNLSTKTMEPALPLQCTTVACSGGKKILLQTWQS